MSHGISRDSSFADPDIVPLIIKAEKDLDALSEDELYRYQRWVFSYLDLLESACIHHHRGVTSDADVEAMTVPAPMSVSSSKKFSG